MEPSRMTPDQMRALRAQLGHRQQDLALALGLTKRAIAHYEGGTRPIPRLVALACLALAHNLDLPEK